MSKNKNPAASALGTLSAKSRKKRLGKKGMSEAMRALANKMHAKRRELTK
jgi:hypothetical protein